MQAQATGNRRFGLNGLKVGAAAIALLAASALGFDYGSGAIVDGQSTEDAVTSVEDYRFLEQNIWDYAPLAQPAGKAAVAPKSLEEIRFIEQNVWGPSPLLPHGDYG